MANEICFINWKQHFLEFKFFKKIVMLSSFLGWADLRSDPNATEAFEEIMDLMSRERN